MSMSGQDTNKSKLPISIKALSYLLITSGLLTALASVGILTAPRSTGGCIDSGASCAVAKALAGGAFALFMDLVLFVAIVSSALVLLGTLLLMRKKFAWLILFAFSSIQVLWSLPIFIYSFLNSPKSVISNFWSILSLFILSLSLLVIVLLYKARRLYR